MGENYPDSLVIATLVSIEIQKKSKQCSPTGQALSLTYGRFFAEFLEDILLVRLGLLDLTTCVGLRYGRC